MATDASRVVGSQKANLDRNIDRLSDGAHQAVDRAAAAASSVADRLNEKVERLGEKGEELLEMKDTWVENARDYVRDHPFGALGMALAAGYVISMITRSR